jgi:hypothetical protein
MLFLKEKAALRAGGNCCLFPTIMIGYFLAADFGSAFFTLSATLLVISYRKTKRR